MPRISTPSRALLTCAAVLLAAAGCRDNNPMQPQISSLNAAEARWQATGHSAYSMVQSHDCFCVHGGRDYELIVINDEVRSATDVQTHEMAPSEERQWFRSVPQLFAEIRSALNRAGATVEATYDPVTGFPVRIWIDPLPNAVDEEFGYRSGNIRQLID